MRCDDVWKHSHRCFFTTCLYGDKGSHYEIGFTHGRKPFVMAEGQTAQFPMVVGQKQQIRIVAHG